MILPERVLGGVSLKRTSGLRGRRFLCGRGASVPSSVRSTLPVRVTRRDTSPLMSGGRRRPIRRPSGDDEGGFDFHRREAVAGDVEHVFDAAMIQVTVFVAAGASGE